MAITNSSWKEEQPPRVTEILKIFGLEMILNTKQFHSPAMKKYLPLDQVEKDERNIQVTKKYFIYVLLLITAKLN